MNSVSNEQSVDGRFEDNRRAVERMDYPNKGTTKSKRPVDFDQPEKTNLQIAEKTRQE